MSPSRSAVALSLLALAAPAGAEALLEVTGSVVSVTPRLEVRVVVSNRGGRAAAPLDVTGELRGERRVARIGGGVAPGDSGTVVLDFETSGARPGVHALTLLLEHPVPGLPDAAGNPPMASQRAWLLLALGATAPDAVRLAADALSLDVRGDLAVRVESADSEPHRVRLRVVTARGLRADGEGAEVDVPAHGPVVAALPIVRAGAPRGSRHAVLVVAEAQDGPLARATVLATPVEVAASPSLLPRLRTPLLVLGLVLLALALGFEAWRRLRT